MLCTKIDIGLSFVCFESMYDKVYLPYDRIDSVKTTDTTLIVHAVSGEKYELNCQPLEDDHPDELASSLMFRRYEYFKETD